MFIFYLSKKPKINRFIKIFSIFYTAEKVKTKRDRLKKQSLYFLICYFVPSPSSIGMGGTGRQGRLRKHRQKKQQFIKKPPFLCSAVTLHFMTGGFWFVKMRLLGCEERVVLSEEFVVVNGIGIEHIADGVGDLDADVLFVAV